MKFTFKTTKPTGKYAFLDKSSHDIKLNKKDVGSIVDGTWIIRLKVVKNDIMEDGNPNCPWKWIALKKESSSLQEAKDFLNANFKTITEKFNLFGD